MKKIKTTIIYLLAFAAALVLLFVVVNLPVFDEELLPEVKAIKNQKPEPFDKNNAYPAMRAFSSTREEPFNQITNELIELLNEKIHSSGKDYLSNEENKKHINSIGTQSWKRQFADCNSRSDATCMQQYVDQMEYKTIENERLLELLNRYQTLIDYKDYKEAIGIDFNAPFIGYGSVVDTKRIFLAHAYHQQSPDDFVKTVFKDLAFWRMVLKKSHLLITKMIANSTIRDSLYALSVLINQQKLDHSDLITLQTQLKPFSPQEFDMSQTFEYEFKYGMTMIDFAEEQEPVGWTKWINFFQKQATHNLNYNYMTKPLSDISKLDSKSFYQKINGDNATLESPVSWSPTMLYNPTGKMMIGYGLPAYKDYIGRIHDLNGMILLLKLQIELALGDDEDKQSIITNSPYKNPYTGEPMSFDTENNRLYFECMEPRSVCEIN